MSYQPISNEQLFNEFLAFKKLREEMSAPTSSLGLSHQRSTYPIPAPVRGRTPYEEQLLFHNQPAPWGAPLPSYQPAQRSPPPPPREIDYEATMKLFLRQMFPRPGSAHPQLFWLFKNLYATTPECFHLTGKAHMGKESSDVYFSFQYHPGHDKARPVNFHAVGVFSSQPTYKFIVQRIDILMGPGEIYMNAAVFNDTSTSGREGSEVSSTGSVSPNE